MAARPYRTLAAALLLGLLLVALSSYGAAQTALIFHLVPYLNEMRMDSPTIIAILAIISPGFLAPMFEQPPEDFGLPAGVVLLGIGGTMMLFGFLAIRRIVDIEV